jgi:large subunit ribosomal protein L29
VKYREHEQSRARDPAARAREQIFRLRFQLSTGQAEGLKKLREAKKDFARSRRCCAKLN